MVNPSPRKSKVPNILGDWDDVRFFLAVAKTGSFSAAATQLNTKQTTVGRRIQVLDLATRQADLAIRFFRPTSNQLVAARVGQFNMSIFAAPSYIEQYGMPQKLEDMREHHIVDHTTLHSLPAMKPWSEVVERSPSVVLRTNSSYAAVEAVRVGYGISVFPDYVTKSSNLVAAPIDLRIVRDIWLVSHEETNKGARIRTVIDYVREQFRQDERDWFSVTVRGTAMAAA